MFPVEYSRKYQIYICIPIWAHLRYYGFGLDHHNKANITIKQVTGIFLFPNACECYVYTVL